MSADIERTCGHDGCGYERLTIDGAVSGWCSDHAALCVSSGCFAFSAIDPETGPCARHAAEYVGKATAVRSLLKP